MAERQRRNLFKKSIARWHYSVIKWKAWGEYEKAFFKRLKDKEINKDLYSLRDTTYKTDNKVVGYSINVTTDYKLEISTCSDNGVTPVKYTSTEVLQSGVKLTLKIQKRNLSYVFSVTYDGKTKCTSM